MNRFDLENQAIQRRIADALERIAELLEETEDKTPTPVPPASAGRAWSLKELVDNQKRAREHARRR